MCWNEYYSSLDGTKWSGHDLSVNMTHATKTFTLGLKLKQLLEMD